jgi:hypothetical protein
MEGNMSAFSVPVGMGDRRQAGQEEEDRRGVADSEDVTRTADVMVKERLLQVDA